MSTKQKKTEWFGMKLTPAQKQKIVSLARRRGVTQTQAVMDLVDREAAKQPFKATPGSVLDGIEHLVGCGDGPRDLSTNPKYMEGYGR